MRLAHFWIAVAFATLVGGCELAPEHYFAPEAATVTRSGLPTEVRAIPDDAPRGTIEVATLGITDTDRGQKALHARIAVTNDADDAPWTMNAQDQLLEIPGVGEARPFAANAHAATLPRLAIRRNAREVVDLYYPLPPSMHANDELTEFDVVWKVDTPARPLMGRTHVERLVADDHAPTPAIVSWGPYWWYDPSTPRVAYRTLVVPSPAQVATRH